MTLSFRRTILSSDVTAVRELVISTGFFEAAPDEIDIAAELVSKALDRGSTDSGYHFIFAEENGDVLSYVCFGPIPCTVGSFDLYWLTTHRKAQRRGLARQIVGEMFRDLARIHGRKVFLETSGRTQYLPTRKFYEACSFVLEARLTDYYAPGDDCLIYSRGVNDT